MASDPVTVTLSREDAVHAVSYEHDQAWPCTSCARLNDAIRAALSAPAPETATAAEPRGMDTMPGGYSLGDRLASRCCEAERERCARVCDRLADNEEGYQLVRDYLRIAARKIRALRVETPREAPTVNVGWYPAVEAPRTEPAPEAPRVGRWCSCGSCRLWLCNTCNHAIGDDMAECPYCKRGVRPPREACSRCKAPVPSGCTQCPSCGVPLLPEAP